MTSSLSFLKAQGIDNLKDASQEDIDKAFFDSISDDTFWVDQNIQMAFNHKDQILAEGKVRYMRSFMDFGSPLHIDGVKYRDITDRYLD